jgi:pilus assembly protein Flp/PilA
MLSSTYNQVLWLREMAKVAIRRRIADERGASLVEYALLLALIAMVCLGAVTVLGTVTGDSVSRTADSVTAAN